MKKYSYFREQYDLLTQFVAAFDDCFVYRYTKDLQKKEKINVRYIMGPKQRVLYDIVNQAKNITLPAISMEQQNIKRDSSRIQFKDQFFVRKHLNDNGISKFPSPIPITMDVNVSIIAGYKEDIDQIASNFIPWSNPYFIISWKIPAEFNLDYLEELRTEVTWSGSVDYESPTNINSQDKYKIIGNTSFNIKGWLFPPYETPEAPIYVVRSNFVAVPTETVFEGYDSFVSLSSLSATTDTILISAYPEITNVFYQGIPIYEDLNLNPPIENGAFTFYGKRFNFNNSWYLSSNGSFSSLVFSEIDTLRYPKISAFKIPDDKITLISGNLVSISLSSDVLEGTKDFTFVTANSAGWANTSNIFSLS